MLAETLEFKGGFLGLAPNYHTPLRNKNLCILVCRVLSAVSGQRSVVCRPESGGQVVSRLGD